MPTVRTYPTYSLLISALPNIPEQVRSVLTEGLNKMLPPETPLDQYNTNYLQHNPNSGEALLSYCRALYQLRGKDAVPEIEESLMQFKQTEVLFPVQVRLMLFSVI